LLFGIQCSSFAGEGTGGFPTRFLLFQDVKKTSGGFNNIVP